MTAPQDLVTLFADYADLAETVQQRILEIDNRPTGRKALRRLTARETAGLLGLSESELRRSLARDPHLPQGESAGAGRRLFSLEAVHGLRRALSAGTGEPRFRPGRAGGDGLQVVAFGNFKGGAAKTTMAVHLAQYLALRGWRVLLLDLDSQASATSLMGFSPDLEFGDDATLYGYLRGEVASLSGLVQRTHLAGLDLIPANLGLYRAEFELPVRQLKEPRFRFWRLLADGLPALDASYDVVVCDCPPSLGYLTINALFAATGLIVPAPASMLDFASTGRFFRMLSETLSDIAAFEGGPAKRLDFVRILVAKLLTTDRNQQRIASWMASTFGERLLRVPMAHTTALDQAGTVKRTLYELEPAARRSQERALEFMDAANAEIEALLLAAWGRPPAPSAREAA
jgi:chromosome partitioning protein